MKKTLIAGVSLAVLSAFSATDRPDVLTFGGTGYHTNGWFSYQAKVHSDKDGLLFDKMGPFVVSPLYAAPIRKVVLNVQATTLAPSRYLRLSPFVGGMEVGTNVLDCAIASVQASNAYEFVSFDFSPDVRVDAFRLGPDGSGTGNWRVKAMSVFFGDREAGEDELLKEFANELPPPANPRIVDFSASTLQLAADPVADAAGYLFKVDRLAGLPRTEEVEHFASTPNLSVVGWTLRSENAKFVTDALSSYVDTKGSSDAGALKIDQTDKKKDVWVEIETRVLPEKVSEISYVAKAGSTNKSDRVVLYGRLNERAQWTQIGDWIELTSSKMIRVTNAVPEELDCRQVKFRFEAVSNSFTVCGLDSLRVVYGGNEERIPVGDGAVGDKPTCDLSGLETARYAVQVQACGGEKYRDSSWSEPLVVDLSWADVVVERPHEVWTSASGGKLTVSWTGVADAEHYLVDVYPEDDPDNPVVSAQKVKGTSLTVTIPSVGAYMARVTAVSPGGKSTATSEWTRREVGLEALETVTAEALDRQTIRAKWKKVPLAESYQVKLVRTSGRAKTDVSDYPSELKGNAASKSWRDGWQSRHVYDVYAGPLPKITYRDSWIATPTYPEPVTSVVCSFKSRTSDVEITDNTFMQVEYLSVGEVDGWHPFGEAAYGAFSGEIVFPLALDVRRVRFRFGLNLESLNKNPLAEFGKVTVTYGRESRTEVRSVSTTDESVTFDGLDPSACYRVTVSPQPSDADSSAAASEAIDLATEKFRRTGAIPLSALRGGIYAEDFNSLSNVTADTEMRKLNLDYWQFFKGTGEAEKMLYTVGTNRTTGGVYVFGGELTPVVGTLATSTLGGSLGVAFRNDGAYPVGVDAVSFAALQRSYRTNPSTYVLEWLITDGATSVGASGDWRRLETPETAPQTALTRTSETTLRQEVALSEALPREKIPVGGVLILRWRQEKVPSGPMMAIDDVEIKFDGAQKGFGVMVR